MAQDDGVADLERLAAGLNGNDYLATVTVVPGRRPCLRITNRHARALTENIYSDGEWFWWGWAERLAPITDVTTAASVVAKVLAAFATNREVPGGM